MGVNNPISTGYILNFILISCQHSGEEDEKVVEDYREQRKIYGLPSGLIKKYITYYPAASPDMRGENTLETLQHVLSV